MRGHVGALTKGKHVAALQTLIGDGESVFLAIEKRQSKI